jgi:hypothetical protein
MLSVVFVRLNNSCQTTLVKILSLSEIMTFGDHVACIHC